MEDLDKSKEDLINLLKKYKQKLDSLTVKSASNIVKLRQTKQKLVQVNSNLAFQLDEKAHRADELVIANKELAYQVKEKAHRADELVVANKELAYQVKEKAHRADELVVANKELAYQVKEKAHRAYELVIANKELAYQVKEKAHRAEELVVTNKELVNAEKEIRKLLETLEQKVENRTAQLVIAKQKAEESDRLKSAFLANMSHEIRTPMNGILGFAELLREPNLSGDEQQKFIKIIEKSGLRMLNIINDIIDISKIESGLMGVKYVECNVNDQIEYLLTFFKPELESKNLDILFSKPFLSKELRITTDKEKLLAILINLIKNAIKFTDKGTIELGYKIVETHGRASLLEFYIKDTGIGIMQNRQKAIFERFIQADIEDKRALQGAGLGLAISKSFVEILKGTIWVESEFGKGSTFYFTIPYANEADKNEDRGITIKNENQDQPRPLKILIVEDDETSALFLSKILSKISNQILFATRGIDAIELCRGKSDIDLILMDVGLPDLNGYEATTQIRLFNKEVIIIAQTGFAFETDRGRAIDSGCNDYISKPIKVNELLSKIYALCKK